jgi:EAL domain-containing protein (putative c-di-GMP-specific phosphodiesterase class I)
MTEDLKAQRDRYIAFSLAAADLLIEVGSDFRIVKTIGATQALLSGMAEGVVGREVCDIFIATDRAFARHLLTKAQTVGRIEPCGLNLEQTAGPPLLVNMGACYLGTGDGNTFISLTVLSDGVMAQAEQGQKPGESGGLLNLEAYLGFARKKIGIKGETAPKNLKLVRVRGLSQAMRQLPAAQSELLLGEISSVLRAQSMGGSAAARLSDEAFSYMPSAKGESASPDAISRDIRAAAVAVGLTEDSLTPSVMNLELSTGNLDEDSIAKALQYVLTDFCKPERSPISSLAQGLKSAMAETVQHFDSIRALIDGNKYTLFYQPVVRLSDRTTHHYEALLRFADGRTPFDTIRLSEQLGLVQDFDLAVAKKAIETLKQRTDVTIAINLSGLSVQSDIFREHLRHLLGSASVIGQRLMFELTESNAIDDLEAAGTFLRWLRRTGYRVCLDDFGSGAATYTYLRNFDVDFVKIDGPFLREARDNPRQRALIRSVSHLCRELDTQVVAEMIEDEAMAKLCQEMSIGFGQGYYFGKPKPDIDTPKELIVGRRKGFTESWG